MPKTTWNPTWPILTRYDHEHLSRIALPLGGIGTDAVSLRVRGQWGYQADATGVKSKKTMPDSGRVWLHLTTSLLLDIHHRNKIAAAFDLSPDDNPQREKNRNASGHPPIGFGGSYRACAQAAHVGDV